MSKQYELEVDADVSWVDGVDPEDWRNLPDMDGDDDSLDEDESLPAPQYVIDVLGFDPDEEDWGESVENAFCPTGQGGGVDPTCSKGGGKGSKSLSQEQRKIAKGLKAEFIHATEIGYSNHYNYAELEKIIAKHGLHSKEARKKYEEMGMMDFEYFRKNAKLSEKESQDLKDYWYNSKLEFLKKSPEVVDKVTKASPALEKDYLFTRGMLYPKKDVDKLVQMYKEGESITFESATPFSITGSPKVAEKFASGTVWGKKLKDSVAKGETPLLLEIAVFKGQKIARTAIAAIGMENESMMPSNSKFEVVGVKQMKSRTVVRMALVSSTHNE